MKTGPDRAWPAPQINDGRHEKTGQDVEDPDRSGETVAASPVVVQRPDPQAPRGLKRHDPYQSWLNLIVKLIFGFCSQIFSGSGNRFDVFIHRLGGGDAQPLTDGALLAGKICDRVAAEDLEECAERLT